MKTSARVLGLLGTEHGTAHVLYRSARRRAGRCRSRYTNARPPMRMVALVAAVALAVSPLRGQGSVLLVGGGTEDYNDWSDAPYRWFVNQAPNKKILILHYSTTSSWLASYFQWLGAVSAASVAVSTSAAADDSATYRLILEHDGIFLRGGDQWQYLSLWKGTLTEQGIREVFERGGAVGGTSAGAHVLSEVIFDARTTSVNPRAALRDPLGAGITLTKDFLGLVPGILVDSHFYERGRIGRLLPMLAIERVQTGRSIRGVGLDYGTALAIPPDGIGEAMGSGPVTILSLLPESAVALESSSPLAMTHIRLDQLTGGWKVDLRTGEVLPAATAIPFVPRTLELPPGGLAADGSGLTPDWYAPGGSVERCAAASGGPSDTIGILVSAAAPDTGMSIQTYLEGRGAASRVLPVDQSRCSDPVLAADLHSCGKFIVAGMPEDSIGALIEGTAFGDALRERVSAGARFLFLGHDAAFAGDSGVGRIEFSEYGAYYGYLTRRAGFGLTQSIDIVTRLYEESDYIDNRVSALFWGMARSGSRYGVLLDNGSHIEVASGQLNSYGLTPAIVVDAAESAWTDYPDFRDPGKAAPRQQAAFVNARIHVLRSGQPFDLVTGTLAGLREQRGALPSSSILLWSYPNPFNSSTTIAFELPERMEVSLEIFNVLGECVSRLVDAELGAGLHRYTWTADVSSGVYLCRLSTPTRGSGPDLSLISHKLLLLR